MTKIKQLKFENIGLLTGNFEIKDDIIVVSGLNQSGKTTFCRAFERICNNAMPADIVASGFDKAACKITLSDGTVIDWSKATDKKPVVKVIYANGKKVNATKDVLAGFVPAKFDVNQFASMMPKQKKEAVAKMSGIDLDGFNQVEKTAEENRKELKRQLSTEQAKIEGLDISKADEQLLDVAELQAELSKAQEANSMQEKQKDALQGLKEKQARVESEISQLLERLQGLKKENGQIISDIQRGQKAVEKHVDHSEKISQLQESIATASETNTAILQARQQAETFKAVDSLRDQVEAAEQAVVDARQARVDAVKSAELPAGLSIDENGQDLYFTDNSGHMINIESANDAEKIIIGLKVALQNMGSVKALAVDLSLLDKINRQRVFDFAKENDLQLFAERVSDDDELTVEFV